MNAQFRYEQTHQDTHTRARTGIIHTPHGDIETPAFVPVGTQASVKSLTPEELKESNTHLFFVNTYHMYLRPGIDVISSFGGLHRFMHWDRPLITDSGGFQVFSLARPARDGSDTQKNLVKITENGVEFKSHWDGSSHTFTPESSMDHQWKLGSDIHIAFDDCTPYPVTHDAALMSMNRTHRWAVRSLDAHKKAAASRDPSMPYQALYGSIQGSVYEDLRRTSAQYIAGLDFDGFGIGGVSVGESKEEMVSVMNWVIPLLPEQKPRHLLGVGEIDDIFALTEAGFDTFDCVQPTRLARMGWLFLGKEILDITKSKYEKESGPVDPSCECYSCMHFSRAYIHHLFHVKELLGYRLATIHNVTVIQRLVTSIRKAIQSNSFLDLKKQWL